MAKVKLTRQTREDLTDIWLYIAAFDPNAAERLLTRLERAIAALGRTPGMGPVKSEFGKSTRFFPVDGYLIFYKIEGDEVRILRVLHGPRDLRSEL